MSEQSPIVIEPTPEPAAAATTTTELPKTKEKVEELNRAASLQYKLKNFSQAADHFADAVEIQAELNGEMAPENAELLFYYGRALYKVAIAKSDVLGGRVAQEEKKKPKKAKKSAGEGSSSNTGAANGAGKAADEEETFESKPYFQITGDENWTDSEDEDEDGEEQRGEEQDDFGDAYEVFEMARVLYTRQLENLDASESAEKGKGKTELSTQARTIKEKLADCHGFLVEISLENERYLDAVGDARSAVTLQEELHPIEHENVTEAHYSLSLALEFASTAAAFTEKEGEPPSDAPPKVDWDLRNDAIKHTELAAEGLEKRLEKEKAALTSSTLTPAEKKEKETIVGEKDALVEELKQRITDLKTDPTKQTPDEIDPSLFKGLLGGLLGADAATQKAKLAEATSSANDISGLVKTKKKAKAPVPETASTASEASNGKRKLEVVEEGSMNGKRAKTEEMQE